MNTEITDEKKSNGWVCYDAGCGFCVQLAERFHGTLASRRFTLVPLQTPWVRERLGGEAELLAEMRLLTPAGKIIGGADALLEIAREFWWAWPIRQLGRVPAARTLFRAGYRWIAMRRGCVDGACGARPSSGAATFKPPSRWKSEKTSVVSELLRPRTAALRFLDFLPLLLLPLLALLCRAQVAPWIFMWVMAFALYGGCKWLTYRLALRNNEKPGWALELGYLLAWPGMDAAEFFDHESRPAKPRGTEWVFAMAKTAFGILLLWGVARLALPVHPLLAGWIGMTGAIFILHFGTFHLLSLAWRHAGVNATPLMRNPLMSASLADFWGARWNTAFNELAFRFTFRPLRRWTNPVVATLLVFGLSGLVHELVISLPAQGGYGLPTLYFLIQGLALVAERTRGRAAGALMRAWFFTLIVTAGPAFWLFHPPFIHNVILPMLTAIGAT